MQLFVSLLNRAVEARVEQKLYERARGKERP